MDIVSQLESLKLDDECSVPAYLEKSDHFAASVATVITYRGDKHLIMGYNWEFNCLDNFGGGRAPHENVMQTALREFGEESHNAICEQDLLGEKILSSRVMAVKSKQPPPRDKNYYLFLVDLGEQDFEEIQDRYRLSIYSYLRQFCDAYNIPDGYTTNELIGFVQGICDNMPKREGMKYMSHAEHTDLALIPLKNLAVARYVTPKDKRSKKVKSDVDGNKSNVVDTVNSVSPVNSVSQEVNDQRIYVVDAYGTEYKLRPVLNNFAKWVLQQQVF